MSGWDPMADAIMAKQQRAYRAMNTPDENARIDKSIEESIQKSKMLSCLKSDPKFREEVRKILNSQE